MKRLVLLLALTASSACGSAGPVQQDAGTPDAPVKNGDRDGGTDAQLGVPGTSIVFVNGVVNGNAKDQTGSAIALSDVRVCIRDATSGTYPYPYALPDATPMPLTNYPGVQRGRGVDLGHATGTLVFEVYLASDLALDATWTTNRSPYRCDQMSCSGSGPPCRPHVTLPQVSLNLGVNVIALVDDAANATVELVATSFDDVTYDGAQGTVEGTIVDFSGWHATNEVGAFYGDYTTGAGPDKTLVRPLVKPPLQPHSLVDPITSYDTLGLRFDAFSGGQPFDRFGQSLDSIAFVSNATLTPPLFYGVRENFVFALVGDPNDPTSIQSGGGRDPTFDGRGLHIVAIPYATPLP